MIQKFRKFTRVKIADEMPSYMSHFPCGQEAIVAGTYLQEYGGDEDEAKQYGLYLLKDDKIVQYTGWYYEHQLTKVGRQNRAKAEQMLEDYQLGRNISNKPRIVE